MTLTIIDWVLIAMVSFGAIQGFFSTQGTLNRIYKSLLGLAESTLMMCLVIWALTWLIVEHGLLGHRIPDSYIWYEVLRIIHSIF